MSNLGRASIDVPNPAPAPDDDADGYDDDDDGYDACQTCAGDGYEDCWEPFDCWEPGCNGAAHKCTNCRGTGSAKDQWYW